MPLPANRRCRTIGGFPPTLSTALLAVVALVVAAACSEDTSRQERPAGPIPVRTQPLQAESVERVVEITGTLGGAELVTVAAEVDGRVQRILADLGDSVEAGAPLIRLEDSELRFQVAQAESAYLQSLARLGVDASGLDSFEPRSQADVRRAEADLAEAKRSLVRGEELMERRLLASSELDNLRTREQIAEAALQKAIEEARSTFAQAKGMRASLGLARKKLRDATIASPVSGAVAKRLVALGEYVRAGQPVAMVVVTDPLKLQGEVPDRYVGQLQQGMPVEIELDVGSGEAYLGELARIGPLISASSHTFPVEALIRDPAGRLRPGLFARARIRIGAQEEVFSIPETAISSVAGVNKVFVFEDGKAGVRPITILRKVGGDAQVQGEGLRSGDLLILTGIARMFEGTEVTLLEPAEAGRGSRGAKPSDAAGEAGEIPEGSEASEASETPLRSFIEEDKKIRDMKEEAIDRIREGPRKAPENIQ